MHYRKLGSSGLEISAIGLGTNQFGGKVDRQGTIDIVHAAIDLGINFIDTADVYQEGRSEEAIGAALKGRRGKAIIATKVGNPVGEDPNERGASRQRIMNGVEASLRRLDTDYIDLYQIHRWDSDTPVDETMRALDDLVRSGRVRYLGASNYSAWQLIWSNAAAESLGLNQFVSIQPHYHLFERNIEAELVPACRYFGIGILPYFPLAGGFLTGKYHRGEPAPKGSRGETSPYVQRYMTDANYDVLKRLEQFTMEHGRSLNDLAHAWLLATTQVSSVISGATRVEQLQKNARAEDWHMTPDEFEAVNQILESHK